MALIDLLRLFLRRLGRCGRQKRKSSHDHLRGFSASFSPSSVTALGAIALDFRLRTPAIASTTSGRWEKSRKKSKTFASTAVAGHIVIYYTRRAHAKEDETGGVQTDVLLAEALRTP